MIMFSIDVSRNDRFELLQFEYFYLSYFQLTRYTIRIFLTIEHMNKKIFWTSLPFFFQC